MPFSDTDSSSSAGLLVALALVSTTVVAVGVIRDYSFMPSRGPDGFLYQIEYARGLLASGDWSAFSGYPLALVHVLRYVTVWPFLAAEDLLGPAGSLTALLLLLWPLLMSFRPQRGDWRDRAYVGLRFAVLLLPLFVSGRTVLVVAGMGYLVSGIMMRPFSGWRMLLGCLAAVLSSASVMFSIVVLLVAGNWTDRSPAFRTAKAFCLILLVGLFLPSLSAKVEGFFSGSEGYHVEDAVAAEAGPPPTGAVGAEATAAVQRMVLRSTVVQSYREGNEARLALYLGLFLAAWAYVLWSAAVRRWHPMLLVLVVLSGGIFLEGLALWPILLPLIWAYTGIVRTERAPAD